MVVTEPTDRRLAEENRRLRRAMEELTLLNELALDIARAREVEELVHTLVRRSLKAVNAERAATAAAEGLEPYVYFRADEVVEVLNRTGGFPFPHIGDHRPDGWVHLDTHFADASGMGADDEPALSVRQLVALIEDRIAHHNAVGRVVGWAVIEAGQFQVRVGEFVRDA